MFLRKEFRMNRSLHSRFLSLLVCSLILALATLARADVTASILGIVNDSSGHPVPNVNVELTNSTTGYHRTATTDSSGAYEFLSVPVGDGYNVTASAAGFEQSVNQGITLLVNQRFRSDFALKVGQVTERVTVSADAVQVDTSTNQLGDVISDKQMIALPLNGRSYTDLMGLQPGVVPITSSAAFTDRPVSGELNAGETSVNGSQESGNSFLINGGDVEEPKNNGAAVIPSLDAIQEFRILTNTFDAEYGRFGGAIVNVITKSGTNQFHGSVYEFLRNEKLNGKNWFAQNAIDPATGEPIPHTARGDFKRNQYGYAFGGPVVKNRLFFFSDWQGTREVRGLTGSPAFVPSAQEAQGDFSDVDSTGYGALNAVVKGSGANSMPVTLTQRLGYTVNTGEPYWAPGCNTPADAQAGICVFPGQKIPQAAWDSAAAGTLKFIPAPTSSSGGSPIYSTSSLTNQLNDDKIGERVTWNERRTGDWSFFFSYDTTSTFNPFAGGNVPGFSGTVPQKAIQGNVSNTHEFNATTVNEVRLNYTRSTIFQTHPSGPGLGPLSSFGFSTSELGLTSTVPSVEGVPSISIGGAYGISMGVVPYAINQVNNTYQLADVLSKIVGKHSLKFGGEARQIQVDEFNISTPNGSFSFDGTETGNGFADYLLGAPASFAQQSYSTFFTRANYGGIFAQDSYRLRPNLTLNAGLRWEIIQPYYEKRGWLNAIDWGVQSTVYPGSPTGWIFPGDKGLPKTISKTPHDDFSPRIGINWSPTNADGVLGKLIGGPGKTSVRAGFGVYYTAIEDQPSFYTIGDAPFGLYYQSPTQVYFNTPFEDRRQGNNPGQRFPFTPPTPGQPINWATYLPIGGSPGVALGNVTPYILQFNLNIQRELPGSSLLSLAYVGTRGHHLLGQLESNPGTPSLCLQVAAELPAGSGCGPHGEDQIYQLPGGAAVNGTRPHSVTSGEFLSQGLLDFTSNPYNITMVNSDYNAFQSSLVKHQGFSQFQVSYTWAKSIDDGSGDTDGINPFNPHLSRSLSAFHMAQNLVISYGIELPKFAGSNALVRTSLGGWQLTGITRFTSGLPVTIAEKVDQSLTGTSGIDTPNWDGQPIKKFNPRSTSTHTYFSASQFSLQPLGTFGNANRRFFTGPGLNNWDMALRKVVQIHDQYSLEFRGEFFNLMNHAQFNNPSGNQSSASFGQVTSARDPRIGQLAMRFAF
jgi:hypothetical protein